MPVGEVCTFESLESGSPSALQRERGSGLSESKRIEVLRALHEKWEQDHSGDMPKYPSKYCRWKTMDGKRTRMPDGSFEKLVDRFSEHGVNEIVDGLKSDDLIELFDNGSDVYYMFTLKGVAELSSLQRSAGA
jgi:hypothetical protein